MSAITRSYIPLRQTPLTSPSGQASLANYGLARELKSLIVGANPIDLITGRHAVELVGNTRSVATRDGEAQSRFSGGARFGDYRSVLGQSPDELTMFCSFVADIYNSGDGPIIFGVNTFSFVIQSYTGGRGVAFYTYYSPLYTGDIRIKTPDNFLVTGETYCFVATAKSEGRVALFCNGRLLTESAYPVGRRINTYFDSSTKMNYGSSDTNSCNLLSGGFIGRAITDEEAILLSSNPKILYAPKNINLYEFPTNHIPFIGDLITTNITQTGARHSLMLTY